MRKYYIVIAIVLPLLILVLIKLLCPGQFRNNLTRWAEPSVKQSNILTHSMLNNLSGNTLMVDISERGDLLKDNNQALWVPAKFILEKDYQKKLRAHEGNILLVSEDPALSARIWMLLSQMGYTNLYILTENSDNEILKYKFRPDTLYSPEL